MKKVQSAAAIARPRKRRSRDGNSPSKSLVRCSLISSTAALDTRTSIRARRGRAYYLEHSLLVRGSDDCRPVLNRKRHLAIRGA